MSKLCTYVAKSLKCMSLHDVGLMPFSHEILVQFFSPQKGAGVSAASAACASGRATARSLRVQAVGGGFQQPGGPE